MIDLSLIQSSIPALINGATVTIYIAATSSFIGMVFGTILGITQSSRLTVLRYFVAAYVLIIRGTPMLIQIWFAFYLLPQYGIAISPLWTAVIAISVNSSAYVCEIVRSGIASVSKGQIEAGKVLGFSPGQINRYIVLPQAIRVILPALSNELTILIKDSSLASVIGVYELTKQANQIISRTYDAISIFVIVTLFYFIIISCVSFFMLRIEQRLNHQKR